MQGVVVVVLTIAVKVLSLTFIPIPDSKTPTSVGATPPTPISMSLRSEEHTSELQSLMRISYAVFCLKKTNTTPNEAKQTIIYLLTRLIHTNKSTPRA